MRELINESDQLTITGALDNNNVYFNRIAKLSLSREIFANNKFIVSYKFRDK